MSDETRPSPESTPRFVEAANLVGASLAADVLFLNASIDRAVAGQLAELSSRRRRRRNVLFILVTSGGDANAAYQIARCLQTSYDRCTVFVTGYCKSAGTLVAIGAHQLVVGNRGELGPLDVQMSKPDELLLRQSGLTATAALSTLHEQAFEAFEHFFLSLVRRSRNAISTRTATHVAVQLTSGLFAPLYEHVDPMHVGEAGLALQIARRYGELLATGSANIDSDALEHLTTGFPSHDFVIDYAQIKNLFKNVRRPDSNEQILAATLGSAALTPGDRPLVAYLSTEDANPQEQSLPGFAAEASNDGHSNGQNNQPASLPAASGTNQGGAATAGELGTAPNAHLAVIGSGRRTARRRPEAS